MDRLKLRMPLTRTHRRLHLLLRAEQANPGVKSRLKAALQPTASLLPSSSQQERQIQGALARPEAVVAAAAAFGAIAAGGWFARTLQHTRWKSTAGLLDMQALCWQHWVAPMVMQAGMLAC